MTKITPELIKSIITQNGTLFVPKSIMDAIGSCVVSNADAIREEGDKLKADYDSFETKEEPILVDYSKDVTIDAYSVYYLPRNSLVPKIAMLCCAYDAAFRNLPDTLRVLDIGSGTGSVVLGLLDLFHNPALSGTCLNMVALDLSLEALRRQRQLVERIGLGASSLRCYRVDLSDPKAYEGKLSIGAPYDMVFAANIFAELDSQVADAILKRVVPLLSETGIIVNVESQSNPAMEQRTYIVKAAKGLGLHMYYPCPPELFCPKAECWNWRTDEFNCPNIMINGEAIETVKVHRAHWTILSKKPCSIYDMLHDKDPQLVWGVAAPIPSREIEADKARYDYEFCTENGHCTGTIRREKKGLLIMEEELFQRGSIIGITKKLDEIKEGWDVVSGFCKLLMKIVIVLS